VTSYIFPPPGGEEETARLLLELADSKYDVVTNTDAGLCFIVPDYLAEKFESAQAPKEPQAPRRGRPRKESE
jgi:hypothetical protein